MELSMSRSKIVIMSVISLPANHHIASDLEMNSNMHTIWPMCRRSLIVY